MKSVMKTLVPEKEWLVRNSNSKLGTISKNKKGYSFIREGKVAKFQNLNEIQEKLGIALFEESLKKVKTDQSVKNYFIYDYPCSNKPFDPVYSIKEKLPLFAKSSKSKSQYCAGYYVIKFRKGWVKSFCPKLITLQRYPYHGPFKTEVEMKNVLNNINRS